MSVLLNNHKKLQILMNKCLMQHLPIDAANQGSWSLSIKLRLECFVIVE